MHTDQVQKHGSARVGFTSRLLLLSIIAGLIGGFIAGIVDTVGVVRGAAAVSDGGLIVGPLGLLVLMIEAAWGLAAGFLIGGAMFVGDTLASRVRSAPGLYITGGAVVGATACVLVAASTSSNWFSPIPLLVPLAVVVADLMLWLGPGVGRKRVRAR